MVKIKIKTNAKGKRFVILVPYAILHLAVKIVTSKTIVSIANRSIRKGGEKTQFQIPNISRHDLKPLLKQLKQLKGVTLVDVTQKDGTEVSIKL